MYHDNRCYSVYIREVRTFTPDATQSDVDRDVYVGTLKTSHDLVGGNSGYSRREVGDKKTRFYKELNNGRGSLRNDIIYQLSLFSLPHQ